MYQTSNKLSLGTEDNRSIKKKKYLALTGLTAQCDVVSQVICITLCIFYCDMHILHVSLC